MSEGNGRHTAINLADRSGQVVKIYDEHSPTYEEVKDFIGGWLEAVSLPNGDLMIIDEEGKLKELEFNFLGTLIWHEFFGPTDTIVGPVAIIKKNMRKDDW